MLPPAGIAKCHVINERKEMTQNVSRGAACPISPRGHMRNGATNAACQYMVEVKKLPKPPAKHLNPKPPAKHLNPNSRAVVLHLFTDTLSRSTKPLNKAPFGAL